MEEEDGNELADLIALGIQSHVVLPDVVRGCQRGAASRHVVQQQPLGDVCGAEADDGLAMVVDLAGHQCQHVHAKRSWQLCEMARVWDFAPPPPQYANTPSFVHSHPVPGGRK